jgi:homoserine dehydrogenase
LAINDLVVVPGFVALDPRGSTVLLGRGGTDLSAVFIATRLEGARVRLLKDVDAIFDRDPAKSGGGARAFAKLDWQTAARIAHPVVQNKAVQLAAEHGLEIEVAALGRGYETVIGSSTKVRSGEGARRPARVAILGCGVVGGGVVERLSQECDSFELVSILIKDPTSRAHHPSRSLFTTDPALLLERGCDIFVDAGSGVEPSRTLVEEFLRRGVPVVSANKLAVVSYLTSGAHRLPDNDQRFLYSAAVGGGAPFLEATGRARGNIRSVEGVLNGTTNYVIDRFQVTSSLEVAIREAQHAGFAEADPGSDLSGSDAAAKIRLIGMAASGSMPPEPEICEALTAEVLESVGDGVLKQVARWEVGRDGEPVCAVRLRRLSADHFLAGARAEENRIEIKLRSGRTIRVAGRGAGRYPTTEAVMADLFETFRGLSAAESGEPLT